MLILCILNLDDGEAPAKKSKKEKKKKKEKAAKEADEEDEEQMDTSAAVVRNLCLVKFLSQLASCNLEVNPFSPESDQHQISPCSTNVL